MKTREQITAMCVPMDGTIREAMRSIDATGMGAAFIVEEGERFAGLVTDGDLRRALLKGRGLDTAIAEIRHPNAVTAQADDPPEKIAERFSEEIHIIPILNGEGQVVDIATFDERISLAVASPSVGERELQYVTECIVSGRISSSGPFVQRFEEIFARFAGTKYAIATSNGTTALHLAMLALGVKSGDEVIVPTLSFIATANAAAYTGATPVFVDVDPNTWTIDPAAFEAAITPKTKAVIPVHLYGHPADMDPILKIAAKHGIAVVEDAAEAHGALYNGKPVSGIGDMGIFSFFGNKIVTTGEGGMLVTNNEEYARTARILRDHGMSPDRRYWHTVLGYNYRLTSLQAALGVAQMERIDDIIGVKLRIADLYIKGLSGIPVIVLPPSMPWARNVYWLFSILVESDRYGMTSGQLQQKLKERDIDTRPFFPPMHSQPIYDTGQHFPVSDRLSREGLSLPSGTDLRPEHIEHVCKAIKELQQG